MNKKLLWIVLLVFALALIFAACEPIETQHEHTYEDVWSRDENSHWHKATCEHTDQTSGNAEHNLVPVPGDARLECDVCGYTKQTCDHPLETEYTANDQGHWRKTTCGHEVENFAPHAYVDGVCTTCGWWKSASDVLFANLSKSDIWDFTLTLKNVVLDSVAINNAELKLVMSQSGQINGRGYFEATKTSESLDDGQNGVVGKSISMKVVIKDNVLYAYGENSDKTVTCLRCGLTELLEKADANLDEIIAIFDELDENTQKIRETLQQIENYAKYLPLDKSEQLVGAFVKENEEISTDKLTAYVINYDLLRKLNNTLANVTVAEYVDKVCGEGFFANIPAFVEGIFDMKVGEIFDLIEKNFGLTFDQVFELIDQVIADYYPDAKVNTIDDLLAAMGKQPPMPVKMFVAASKNSRFGFLLEKSQILYGVKISVDDIVAAIKGICNTYGDKTIYEIIATFDEKLTADGLKQTVSSALNIVESASPVFYVDSEGTLQKATADGVFGSIALTRNLDLTQDYSQVITLVTQYYDAQK